MELGTEAQGLRASRRNVVRGAAWSVPVIAVATAAPAFAASPCDPRTNQVLAWDSTTTTNWTRTNSRSGSASYDPDGNGAIPALTLSVSTGYTGNMRPGYEFPNNRQNPSLRVSTPVGGLSASGLALYQSTTSTSPQGRNEIGTYTFTFSRPVTNLRLTLTDIDSAFGDFWDVVELSAGYTVTNQGSGLVVDNGGPGGTQRFYRNTNNGSVDNETGNAGNLGLQYAGPISTFTVSYWNGASQFSDDVDTDQVVYISDMTFDYKPC